MNVNNNFFAIPTGDVYKNLETDADDYLFFQLQDKEHRFIIGLSDILACIKFAEEQGEIPPLPGNWWSTIISMYPILERPIE